MSESTDPNELLCRLKAIAAKAPAGSVSARVLAAMSCEGCGTEAHIVALGPSIAEFECRQCRRDWAVEVPPLERPASSTFPPRQP
jgi:hypothetical protein